MDIGEVVGVIRKKAQYCADSLTSADRFGLRWHFWAPITFWASYLVSWHLSFPLILQQLWRVCIISVFTRNTETQCIICLKSHRSKEIFRLGLSSLDTASQGRGCGAAFGSHQCNFNSFSGNSEEFSFFSPLPPQKKFMKCLSPPVIGLGEMRERNSGFPGETANFQKEAFPTPARSPWRTSRWAHALQGKALDWTLTCHLPGFLP